MIGMVGWAVIFGAFLAWEGLGLTVGGEWPTLSHMLRTVTRSVPGRWVAFAFWLWIGWHLFIRGWHFFLRGQLPESPPGRAHGVGFKRLWAEAILPLAGTYALFLAGLRVVGRRAPLAHPPRERLRPAGWPLVWFATITVLLGYAAFVSMIALDMLLAGQRPSALFLPAVSGGAALAFLVVLPGFVGLSVILTAARRRRGPADVSPGKV